MKQPYTDAPVTPALAKKALNFLKYMRTVKTPLDVLCDHPDYPVKVRHVAEECLRAAAGRPLASADREATITGAIKLCIRFT